MNLLTLNSSVGEGAQRVPRMYVENLSCLSSGWELEKKLFTRHKCWRNPLFCYLVLLPHSRQKNHMSESPSLLSHSADFLTSHPTQLLGIPKTLSVHFLCKIPVLAHVVNFPKVSQMLTKCKQVVSHFGISHTSC